MWPCRKQQQNGFHGHLLSISPFFKIPEKESVCKDFSEVWLFQSLISHEKVHPIPGDRIDPEVSLLLFFHVPT